MRLIFINGSDCYIDIIAEDIDIKPADTVEEIEAKAVAIKETLKKDYGMHFVFGVSAEEPKKEYRYRFQINRAIRRHRKNGPFNPTGENTNFAYVVIDGDKVAVTANRWNYKREELRYEFGLEQLLVLFNTHFQKFVEKNIQKDTPLSALVRAVCYNRRLSRKYGLHFYNVDIWNWYFYILEQHNFLCMDEIEELLQPVQSKTK